MGIFAYKLMEFKFSFALSQLILHDRLKSLTRKNCLFTNQFRPPA